MKSELRLLVLLSLAGCKAQAPGTPEGTYRNFVDAVAQAHDTRVSKPLAEFFDAPTLAMLDTRAKAAAQASGKTLPPDAEYQALLGGPTGAAVSDIQVLQRTDDAATLHVVVDGGPGGDVKLVRENGHWRIHLDALDAPAH